MLRVDGVHNLGTHFIIGRTVGEVFNPVVGGPDRVVNLESSVEHASTTRCSSAPSGAATRHGFRASYTLAQGVQLRERRPDPVRERPDRPERTSRLEYGPTPNDQRHRFTVAALGATSPAACVVAPIWTIASGVPMDILMPDAQSRVPAFQRNAGGRLFKTAADLNRGAHRPERRRRRRRRSCCRS